VFSDFLFSSPAFSGFSSRGCQLETGFFFFLVFVSMGRFRNGEWHLFDDFFLNLVFFSG